MANRIQNERLEIKLTEEEKALFEEEKKTCKMRKYETFYPQVRFRKGNLSSRFRTFQRFTRAKTIGEDYTEERLKERIAEREMIKTPPIKKRIGNIIDMNTNTKVKESKGY